MNRRTRMTGLIAAAVASLVLTACGSSDSGGGSTDATTYKLGVIDNSGGAFASNNKTAVAGVNYAVKLINDAGGINGHQVEVIVVDTQGEPKNATTQVPNLVEQGAVAIVGPVDSGTTEIAYATAKSLSIPGISPGAGRPGVLESSRPWGFSLAETDIDVSTPVLVDISKTKGYKTAAIIGDDVTATTVTQIPLFQGVFDQAGVSVVANASFKTGDSSFASQITQIAAAKPDVLALAAGPADAGRIAREVRSQGLTFDLMGTSSLQSGGAAYFEAGGDATEGTLSAAQYDPTNPEQPAKDLLAAAQTAENLPEIPLNYAYAFDAVNMIAQVIKEKNIQPGDDLAASRQSLQAGIQAITSFNGMAGETTFKENGTGDRPSLEAIMQGGQFRIQH